MTDYPDRIFKAQLSAMRKIATILERLPTDEDRAAVVRWVAEQGKAAKP